MIQATYQQRIMLDRYAQKDPHAKPKEGDLVIVKMTRSFSLDGEEITSRELGQITEVTNGGGPARYTVELENEIVADLDRSRVEVIVEKTPEDIWQRLANGICKAEFLYLSNPPDSLAWQHIQYQLDQAVLPDQWKPIREFRDKVYSALSRNEFIPAGRIQVGLGREDLTLTLFNCYVLPRPEDSRHGITRRWGEMFEIFARGGGIGFDVSSMRPAGAPVAKVSGRSSGAISWMEQWSQVTGEVEQGGCFSGNTRIATTKGLIRAEDLANRIDAGAPHCVYTHSRPPRHVTHVFRNGQKRFFRVTTKRGYEIEVTGDHKMGVLKEGRIETVPLKHLSVGDNVLLLLPKCQFPEKSAVELSAIDYEKPKMSTTLNEDVRFPITLNGKLAYVLGYMYGNGSVIMGKKVTWSSPKGISMSVPTSREDIACKLQDYILDCFGVVAEMEPGDGACVNVKLYSRIVVEWLNTNGLLKKKAADIRVPEQIFHAPETVVSSFVSGYFDADGSDRGIKGGYGFDSISKGMLQDVQKILASFGIAAKLRPEDRSSTGWSTLYRLSVTGPVFKERFMDFARWSMKAQRHTSRRDTNMYPMEAFKSCQVDPKLYKGLVAISYDVVSYAAVSRVLDRAGDEGLGGSEQAAKMDALLNVLPDAIDSIEDVGMMDAFDFEVDEVHMLSGDGFYTSNSRRGATLFGIAPWHPDVERFIEVKSERSAFRMSGDELLQSLNPEIMEQFGAQLRKIFVGKEDAASISRSKDLIKNANISVLFTEAFMDAVERDDYWDFVFPDTSDPEYDAIWHGDIEAWRALGKPVIHYGTKKARDLWYRLIDRAWASGEPGVLFVDRMNEMSNSWYYAPIECTNPCVTGDSLIYTSRGLITVDDLMAERTQPQYLVDSRFGYEPTFSEGTKFWCSGEKPIYRLETKEGYTIRATADHKIMTSRGWVQLAKLKEGDKVHIANRGGAFGKEGTLEFGRVLGWFIGDGYFTGEKAILDFYGDKHQLADTFVGYVQDLVGHDKDYNPQYNITGYTVEARDLVTIQSERLYQMLHEFGITEDTKLRVPKIVQRGTADMQRGFLQALFDADGSVQGSNKNPTTVIRLTSISDDLLIGVQQLLLNFGIACRIYWERRPAGYRKLPDGKGGLKRYWCQAYHELEISKANLQVFADEIGFLRDVHQGKLRTRLAAYIRPPQAEKFTARVFRIESDGVEKVYDVTVHNTHSFVSSGICLANCGEQSLPANSVCNLGHINLAQFVRASSENFPTSSRTSEDAQRAFNLPHFRDVVATCVRFLDNVIDVENFFIPAVEERQRAERRVGLGILGYGELLVRLGLRYGSDEAVDFTHWLFQQLAEASYRASVDLAKDRGEFPLFDAEKFLQSGFMKGMPSEVRDAIREHGIRNVTLNTIAPTGSVGTAVGTTTGIEPYIALNWLARSRVGEAAEKANVMEKLEEKFGERSNWPDYFVTIANITPSEHVRTQAAAQRWIDSSISKCVTGDTLIATTDGLIRIASLHQGEAADSFRDAELEVASVGPNQKTSAFYYGGPRTVKKVVLHSGHTVKGTENHRLLVGTVDGLRWVRMDQIQEGDLVAARYGADIWSSQPSKFADFSPSQKYGNQKSVKHPIEMTEDLAWLLGAYAAEGHTTQSTWTITITNSVEAVLQKAVAVWESEFGVAARITRQSGKCPGVEVASKEIVEFFDYLGCGHRSNEKRIPEVVLRSPKPMVLAFLQGLFLDAYTTDGTLTKWAICLNSNGMLDDLQAILTNLGVIHSRISKYNPDYDKHYDEVYACGLDAQKLMSMVPFMEPDKKARADAILAKDLSSCINKADIVPVDRRALHELIPHGKRKAFGAALRNVNTTFPSRHTIERFAAAYPNALPDYVRTILDSDLHFSPVMSIADDGVQEVFDLSVPDNHAFVGNGIVNHNTVNLPQSATIEDVSEAYLEMYRQGCKGGTVYRDRSRDRQVLYTLDEQPAIVEELTTAEFEEAAPEGCLRPRLSVGIAPLFTQDTPVGHIHVAIRHHPDNHQPYDIFVVSGKGNVGADVQALARLMSMIMRWPNNARINQTTRLEMIHHQLQGIVGHGQVGFGPNAVVSLPDGIARSIRRYLEGEYPQTVPADTLDPALKTVLAKLIQHQGKDTTLEAILSLLEASASNNNGMAPIELTSADGASEALHWDVPNDFSFPYDMCPSCGRTTLLRIPGKCADCKECGYSAC